MDMLLHLLLMALIVMLTAAILPGTHVKGFWSSLVVAIVIALLNFFIKPFMILITLPITILTFGLFLFVLNALVVWLAACPCERFLCEKFWLGLAFRPGAVFLPLALWPKRSALCFEYKLFLTHSYEKQNSEF